MRLMSAFRGRDTMCGRFNGEDAPIDVYDDDILVRTEVISFSAALYSLICSACKLF